MLFLSLFFVWAESASAADCQSPVARLVSVEGKVTARSSKEGNWRPIAANETFCPGDAIQVGKNSRAALLLSDHSLVRLDAQSRLAFTSPEKKEGTWIELLKGIGHFISRVPRSLNISTPFLNAMVEGTEFLIRVGADETFLTVFEGTVAASNAAGQIKLKSGQSAVARSSQGPVIETVLRPRDAVQWALYYPAILQFNDQDFAGHGPETWQSRVAQSIKLFKADKRKKAFEALSEITGTIDDPRFFTYRAALRLTVGQAAKAVEDLDQALRLKPEDGDALALMAVIALVQNDKAGALKFANRAIIAAPDAAGPRLARSFVWQAHFKVNEAQGDVETAVAQSPDNALLWSRLAELRLMRRDLDGALDAAQKAVKIDSGISRTQTALGFAHLIRIDIAAAKSVFEKAIVLDQSAPLPRLGLGLARIRAGELDAGRREIEIAAMLDPSNALVRSYLGKAYYEEKRNPLALDQYKMARILAPNDPTPDLYSAILNQTANKPVQALEEIEQSITLNGNRAVYRSRLLLDEDLAARSAGKGRIYQDLGFLKRALVEGWHSTTIDPGNYSGHRLLADSYATLPRHQIARVSELLQSQLLQPLNMTSIQPQLAESNLAILEGAGPSEPSFNEFNPLFVRNRMAIQVNGVAGSNDTWGNDLAVSMIEGKTSLSLGQFHYETDGFRKNNDLEHNIYTFFAQMAVTPNFNLQTELRRRKTVQGDLELNFDPSDFMPNDRRNVRQDIVRIGSRFAPSARSDVIFSLIYSDRDEDVTIRPGMEGPAIDEQVTGRGYKGEAQYILRHNRFNVTAGVGRYDVDNETHTVSDWALVPFPPSSPFFPFTGMSCPPPLPPPSPTLPCDSRQDFRSESDTAYFYSNITVPNNMTWTVGLGYDSFKERALDFEAFNPKVGMQWNFSEGIRFRSAYIETVKRSLTLEQTIEPTQVAGFNQFFDEPNGTQSERYGVGIDAHLLKSFYLGIEGARREAQVPAHELTSVTFSDRKEDLYRTYLYWTPRPEWTVSTEYQLEKVSDKTSLGPSRVDTTTVPIIVRYFRQEGVFSEIRATYLRQKVDLKPASTFKQRSEDIIVLDVAVGYRMPKRWGIIMLEAKNLLDDGFLFQDTSFLGSEPSNPRFTPERIFLLRISLNI